MPKKALTPPDLNTQHGRLRWAREAQGYPSARIAAAMIRVNENTYKSHEGGLRRKGALPLDDAKSYAKKFGVDLAWLLTGQGSPFPNERKKPDPSPPTPSAAKARKAA